MVSMSDELKERNILKLILMVRFACATLDVGHAIFLLGHTVAFNLVFRLTAPEYLYSTMVTENG
jgi:hypothetical protein